MSLDFQRTRGHEDGLRGGGTVRGGQGGAAAGSGQAPGRMPVRATWAYQRALALGMRVPVG